MFERVVHFGSGAGPKCGSTADAKGSEPVLEMVHFESPRTYRATLRRLTPSSRAIRRLEKPFW